MDAARVSDHERPRKTLAAQRERGLDIKPRPNAPIGWQRSAGGSHERVEPKRDQAILGLCARSLNQSGKTKRLIGAVGPKIEFELRSRIETHLIERLVKRGRIKPSEAKAVGAERAGRHDLQAVCSLTEVVERLGVGLVGAGVIESRNNPPRTALSS